MESHLPAGQKTSLNTEADLQWEDSDLSMFKFDLNPTDNVSKTPQLMLRCSPSSQIDFVPRRVELVQM